MDQHTKEYIQASTDLKLFFISQLNWVAVRSSFSINSISVSFEESGIPIKRRKREIQTALAIITVVLTKEVPSSQETNVESLKSTMEQQILFAAKHAISIGEESIVKGGEIPTVHTTIDVNGVVGTLTTSSTTTTTILTTTSTTTSTITLITTSATTSTKASSTVDPIPLRLFELEMNDMKQMNEIESIKNDLADIEAFKESQEKTNKWQLLTNMNMLNRLNSPALNQETENLELENRINSMRNEQSSMSESMENRLLGVIDILGSQIQELKAQIGGFISDLIK